MWQQFYLTQTQNLVSNLIKEMIGSLHINWSNSHTSTHTQAWHTYTHTHTHEVPRETQKLIIDLSEINIKTNKI